MSSAAAIPEGVLLVLDTSGPAGHVAVAKGGEVVAEVLLAEPGRHAAGLVPAIAEALSMGGSAPTDLTGVVVGEGPGSFTGVRVAAATGKGLARALDIPLYPVSSLAAAAVNAPADRAPEPRMALFDARGDRVFAGCFQVDPDRWDVLIPPHASDLRAVLATSVPLGTAFLGSGAERHRAAIEAAGHTVLPIPWGEPTAGALLRALALEGGVAAPSLEVWEPRYLKASSAERAWVR